MRYLFQKTIFVLSRCIDLGGYLFQMVVTDVYNHRFHKIFGMQESISQIMDRDDIFVYEVPVTTYDDAETMIVPLYMREERLV